MNDQLTFLSEEHHASPSPSPDCERDWTMRVATWPSNLVKFLQESARTGSFGKTSPEFCPATGDAILQHFWDLSRDGAYRSLAEVGAMPELSPDTKTPTESPTEFLTLNISEWPKDGAACSLSDILETGDLPRRYFLSEKACAGILRRAAKRGKKLPEALQRALSAVVRKATGTGDHILASASQHNPAAE